MRWLKFTMIFLFGIPVLCTVVAAVILATLDNEDYSDILTWTVDHFTDYTISMQPPFSFDLLSMEPSLSASEILIEPDENGAPSFTAQIGSLKTRLALRPLLSGAVLIRELLIEDATVSFIANDDSHPGKSDEEKPEEESAPVKIPIFENVTLRNVSINVADRKKAQAVHIILRHFNIDDIRDAGPLFVKGEGAVNANDFTIEGSVGSLTDALRHTAPYPVKLNLNVADLDLAVSGTVADVTEGTGLDLHVTGKSPDLTRVLKILKKDIPKLGQLNLEATITGDAAAPNISNLNLTLSGGALNLSAQGSMSTAMSGGKTGIVISGSTTSRDLIRLLLPEKLHAFVTLSFEGTLHEAQGDFPLDKVTLSASYEKGLTFKASGGIILGNIMKGLHVKKTDLAVQLSSSQMMPIKPFLFDWLPDAGPVTADARLKGPLDGLSLEHLKVAVGKSKALRIHVDGRLGRIPIDADSSLSDIDLSLLIESDKPKVLFSGLDMSLPELASVSGKARLRGSGDKLQFEGIDIQVTEPAGVKLDLSGSAALEQREKKTPLGRLDLLANLKAPSIASFRHLLEAKTLPDLAPASLTGHITGTTESLSLEDIVLQAGHSGPVHFTWRGRIGKVVFGADRPVSDVEIAASIYAEKTSLLSKYAGVSIPDLGPLEGSSRIVVRKDGYGADNIGIVIGGKENVRLKAKGRIEYVMRGTSVGMDGIDLAVTIPGLDGKDFSELLGQHVAALGKLSGNLTISGKQEDLSVSDADLVTVSPNGLKISARGGISHIRMKESMPFHGVDINLSATAPDISAIRKITDLDLPPLGALSVSLGVNDRDKALIIDPLQIRTGPEEKPTLLIEGMMHPVAGQDRVTGTLTFKTRTRPWAEKFLGHPVPEDHRLEGDLRLSGKKNKENLEGTIQVGKTKIIVAVKRSLKNERPHVVAKVSAPKIYLSDVDIYPEVPPHSGHKQKKTKSASVSRLFRDEPLPFESLKKLDLSLDLDADEVIGKGFVLNNMDLHVALDGGHLQHRIPKVTFAEGFVTIEGAIDARGPKPELMLKVTAEDIDAAALLAHIHSSMLLGGHLNVAIDLQSSGSSPREIASALKGEFGIAIENGQIKKLADLMGADAIDMVTTSYKLGKYHKLNCLAMAFAFDDGIGTSKVIYVDTPDMRSVGKGTVNLREETIDIVIQPHPKKGQLGGSSPVHINGPLAKPHIVKIPLRAAARLTGEVLMPYVFLPARGAGYVWSLMKNDKDEESPCLAHDK